MFASFKKTIFKTLCVFLFLGLVQCQSLTKIPQTGSTKGYQKTKSFTGKASWYGGKFHGRKTASGERYNQYAMTAAHKKLPFGTRLLVKNLANGRKVIVRINDRGPFIRGRVLDVSKKAAQKLGFIRQGVAKIKAYILKPK